MEHRDSQALLFAAAAAAHGDAFAGGGGGGGGGGDDDQSAIILRMKVDEPPIARLKGHKQEPISLMMTKLVMVRRYDGDDSRHNGYDGQDDHSDTTTMIISEVGD